MSIFACFLRDETAATAIEYAIIASGIATVIVTAVFSLGGQLGNTYSAIASNVSSASR
jgi:pilus assembly protein Flp/PilA